jgi:hypothetical protein
LWKRCKPVAVNDYAADVAIRPVFAVMLGDIFVQFVDMALSQWRK